MGKTVGDSLHNLCLYTHFEQLLLRPEWLLLCKMVLYAHLYHGTDDRLCIGQYHHFRQIWFRHYGSDDGCIRCDFDSAEKDGDTVTWGSFAEYPLYFYLTLGICLISLGAAAFLFYRRRNGKPVYAIALPLTVAACTFCAMSVVYFGAYTPQRAEEYIDKAIDKEGDVTIAVSSDDFFRIDISQDRDNYPMFWGLPCMRTFHSVVPASIMEFYPEIGITRDVASRADLKYKAIRYLFSVRYYFDEITEDNSEPNGIDLPGFSYYDTQNGFFVYKNDYALPMGFTFDTYVEASNWKNYTEETRCNLLLRALVLDQEQVEKYGKWMQPLSASNKTMTDEDLLKECRERATTACDTFQYDSRGFQATIETEEPNLVFFSVPWDEG